VQQGPTRLLIADDQSESAGPCRLFGMRRRGQIEEFEGTGLTRDPTPVEDPASDASAQRGAKPRNPYR
jgi:hypothetical protein